MNEIVGKADKKRLRSILEKEGRRQERHNGQDYYVIEDGEDKTYLSALYSQTRGKTVKDKRFLCMTGKARLYRETSLGGLKQIYVDPGRSADKLRLEACFREAILDQWEELRQRSKVRTGTMKYVGQSFVTLTKQFLKERNLSSKDIIVSGEDRTMRFADSDLAIDWAEYHKEHAEIKYVHSDLEDDDVSYGSVTYAETETAETAETERAGEQCSDIEEYGEVDLATKEGLKKASKYLDEILERKRAIVWRSGKKREDIEGVYECRFLYELYKKSRKRFGEETPRAPKGYFICDYKGMRSVHFEMWNGYSSVMGARSMVLKEPTHHVKVQGCFREAVQEQVQQFKWITFASNKEVQCALTGEKLERGNCHVDHYEPDFVDLTRDFLSEKKMSENDLETQGYGPLLCFKDQQIREEWAKYHENKAKLRLTSADANFGREKSRFSAPVKARREKINGTSSKTTTQIPMTQIPKTTEQKAKEAIEYLKTRYGRRFEQEWKKFST